MGKETLIIKNFGPIKEVNLDLRRFTILIGEQATGKSTIAKVLALCRYFSFIADVAGPIPQVMEGLFFWGIDEYVKHETFIKYSCKHYELTIEQKKDIDKQTKIDYPDEVFLQPEITPLTREFEDLLNEFYTFRPKDNGHPPLKIPYNFFTNNVRNILDNPFYLPTERGLQSVFSLGRGGIPNLTSFLFNYFSKTDEIFDFSLFKEIKIEPLNITYVNEKGNNYVKKNNDSDSMLLRNAASGYQSTIPIVLVVQYYVMRERKKTFIIEEPELNLFPTAQDKLMQFLVDKIVNADNRILLTTHSPYILSSINNMIYAYWVGLVHPNEIKEIIPEKYWLAPDDVSAYRLLNNGTEKNILDNNIKQIDVGELDEVSGQINEIWDKIANIEFDKKYYED